MSQSQSTAAPNASLVLPQAGSGLLLCADMGSDANGTEACANCRWRQMVHVWLKRVTFRDLKVVVTTFQKWCDTTLVATPARSSV